MVYGYRGGYDLSVIPRVSYNIASSGPGVVVVPNSGVAPSTADLAKMQIGDILCFDADSSDGTQIDHVGIYLGLDETTGVMRFYSSRKSVNGPTFADVGGNSVVGSGTGTYATSLRLIRRF
jgi:cell wall-associated NlpC family hydrolase